MTEIPDYSSFDYLDDGAYEPVEMPASPHAGKPYEIPLDGDDETHADRFLAEMPLISLHEHPAYLPDDDEVVELPQTRRQLERGWPARLGDYSSH
jgi:hypothetical protein